MKRDFDKWKEFTDIFAVSGTAVLGCKLLKRLLWKLLEEDY